MLSPVSDEYVSLIFENLFSNGMIKIVVMAAFDIAHVKLLEENKRPPPLSATLIKYVFTRLSYA